MWKVLEIFSDVRGSPASHRVGERGEDLACAALKKKGYRILGRNLPLRFTEIDILAEAVDRDTVVLVEVKTRTRTESAAAQDMESLAAEFAVDADKRKLLVRAARTLTEANKWYRRPIRIDVVAVELADDPRKCIIRHREDVIK